MKRIILTLLLLLAFPAIVKGQPVHSTVTTQSGTASSCSFSVTSAGTNPLMVAVIHLASGSGAGTVTDADFNGAALTFKVEGSSDSNITRTEIWRRYAPAASTATFTANFSSSVIYSCEVYIATNAHQSAADGNTASIGSSGTTMSQAVASATTEIVYGAFSSHLGSACTPNSGDERYDANVESYQFCDSTQTGAATTTPSFDVDNSGGFWGAAVAAFKEPAAGGGSGSRRFISD